MSSKLMQQEMFAFSKMTHKCNDQVLRKVG